MRQSSCAVRFKHIVSFYVQFILHFGEKRENRRKEKKKEACQSSLYIENRTATVVNCLFVCPSVALKFSGALCALYFGFFVYVLITTTTTKTVYVAVH